MKIISNKLYEKYTKEIIGFDTDYSKITKEQLAEVFKFHCANLRIRCEVVDYIYNLIQQDNDRKRDNKPFAKEIYHAMCNQLEDKNQQLKEVIEEARKFINDYISTYENDDDERVLYLDDDDISKLLQILDEAEDVE